MAEYANIQIRRRCGGCGFTLPFIAASQFPHTYARIGASSAGYLPRPEWPIFLKMAEPRIPFKGVQEVPRIPNGFHESGWFYLPTSIPGSIIAFLAIAFCATVFLAIDRNSQSVSDTRYGFFPFFTCAFLLVDWIGSRTLWNNFPLIMLEFGPCDSSPTSVKSCS